MNFKILSIIIGGGAGAFSRFAVSGFSQKFLNQGIKSFGLFPWGTLSVNWIGSFIIGFAWGFLDNYIVSIYFRNFFLIGFLGSFTTFSTFSLETFQLFRQGEIRIAIFNMMLNNFGCIALVFLGFYLFSIIFKN